MGRSLIAERRGEQQHRISALYPRWVRAVQGTVVLATLAALLAACGSYTKRDFIARADAICASTARETRSIAAPSFAQAGRQQQRALAGYLAAVLPVVESERTQLQALKRPPGSASDRGLLARYLASSARAVGAYRVLAAAARRGEAPGVASAEAALRANPVASLAASYGLRVCGTPGATVR